MNEIIRNNEIIDLSVSREVERKFVPLHPEVFAGLKNHETTIAIEQVYLSSPGEPFSLRLRASAGENGLAHEATLKDRGEMRPDGLSRLEVTTPISPELYRFYTDDGLPTLHKLRAEPIPEITIDFYEDGTTQIESENEAQWQLFTERYGEDVIEVTGLPEGDNERRAFGELDNRSYSEVEVGTVLKDIFTARAYEDSPKVVHMGGRSGSGKSTIVRELASKLDALGVSSNVISTDDYHRGQTWLTRHNNGQPWRHWDDPIVYDTKTMMRDLQRLRSGEPIIRREIDWLTVEPRHTSTVLPAEVIILEGLYATIPEITAPGDLVYELQTPLATCIGRRLLRDIKERPQFADPAESLAYMLVEVEPAYRKQHSN